jgi:hypothetical protein
MAAFRNIGVDSISGLLSGFITAVICAPLDTIRTRFQVQHVAENSKNYKSIKQGVTKIVSEEGIRGLYRGCTATIIVVPMVWGLYFPTYNFIKKRLEKLPLW